MFGCPWHYVVQPRVAPAAKFVGVMSVTSVKLPRSKKDNHQLSACSWHLAVLLPPSLKVAATEWNTIWYMVLAVQVGQLHSSMLLTYYYHHTDCEIRQPS